MPYETLNPDTLARIRAKMVQAGVAEADLEEHFVLGSGPGGQKVNKTASTVSLKHLPTGTVVKCGKMRSREANRWLARRQLADKLLEKIDGVISDRQQEAEKIRRQKRRRSRRQQARVLADKKHQSDKKAGRRTTGEG